LPAALARADWAVQMPRDSMAEVNVYYDPRGRTVTVWFGRPEAEHVCEETGDEVVLMKDRKGRVIGFERLNFPAKAAQSVRMAFQTVSEPLERAVS
jgi:uncharacterized protein YuzE